MSVLVASAMSQHLAIFVRLRACRATLPSSNVAHHILQNMHQAVLWLVTCYKTCTRPSALLGKGRHAYCLSVGHVSVCSAG